MTRSSSGALFTVLFLLTTGTASADDPVAETLWTPEQREACNRVRLLEKETGEFLKIGFGTGYGAVARLGGRPRVAEAQLVSGIVRVTRDNDVQFGPVLEMHKFFAMIREKATSIKPLLDVAPKSCKTDLREKPPIIIGIGPFVGLRVGGDDVVQTFALGTMFGFRKDDSDKSLNVGLAYTVDPSVRVLGHGIKEDAPLPEGETQIRYRNTYQRGFMVLFSVGW